MNDWVRKLCIGGLLLVGLHGVGFATYAEGNPLTNADPSGLASVPRLTIPRVPPRPVPVATTQDPLFPAAPQYESDIMCLKESCTQIRAMCRAECSETALPTQDFGMTFFRCVNACVAKNGC